MILVWVWVKGQMWMLPTSKTSTEPSYVDTSFSLTSQTADVVPRGTVIIFGK